MQRKLFAKNRSAASYLQDADSNETRFYSQRWPFYFLSSIVSLLIISGDGSRQKKERGREKTEGGSEGEITEKAVPNKYRKYHRKSEKYLQSTLRVFRRDPNNNVLLSHTHLIHSLGLQGVRRERDGNSLPFLRDVQFSG